jgi:cytochrome P450
MLISSHKGPSTKKISANIVQQMLDSDMPLPEKSTRHLALEVRSIVTAGTEPAGHSLSVTVFHLLSNPDKAQRLKEELRDAQESNGSVPLTFQQLEQLPYLVGSIYK